MCQDKLPTFSVLDGGYLQNKLFIFSCYHQKEKPPGMNCLASHTYPHPHIPLMSLDQFFVEAISIWIRTDRPMYIFLEITAFSVHVLIFQ